jgi:hypothetical protein
MRNGKHGKEAQPALWEEDNELLSILGPVCPWCGRRFAPQIVEPPAERLYFCNQCSGGFTVCVKQTPLGRTYATCRVGG